MLSSLSKLSTEQLKEIKDLEKSIGKTLLSYSSYDVVAEDLTEQELLQVRKLEKKLGTVLVAVRQSGLQS